MRRVSPYRGHCCKLVQDKNDNHNNNKHFHISVPILVFPLNEKNK